MDRLSPKEIRSRAALFAREWADAHYEKGEAQSFWIAFFEIFGVPLRRVATFEHAVERLKGGKGFIDLFWPGQMIVEQKSKGRDMLGAERQAKGYLHGLSDAELPRWIVACDFQSSSTACSEDSDTRPCRTIDSIEPVVSCGTS